MKRIEVRLKDRAYGIVIGSGLLHKSGKLLLSLHIGRDAVCITNKRLLSLYGPALRRALVKAGMSVRFETVPDSEKAKSLDVALRLVEKISRYAKQKKIFLIALGGGVVGDLTGFVAAIYKRGVPYIQIPTTLLAQVDSSIGGKTAIDLPAAKNLVGAFHQPRMVISDIELLASLSRRQVKSGISEVIKYSIIKDAALFDFLMKSKDDILRLDRPSMEKIVSRSSGIKAEIVSKDELDKKGLRAILNFGHTIGHAIEAASKYSARYNHGEAVAVGMIAAADIASEMGILSEEDFKKIESIVRLYGLPADVKGIRFRDVYEAHLHDKKFLGTKNRFVLPRKIGNAVVVESVPDPLIRSAIIRRMI